MKVLRRTPRSDLAFRAITTRMGVFYEKLASEMGLELTLIDESLTQFARLSTRIVFEDGEVDFALAQTGDGSDTILQKFVTYLDTGCIGEVDQAFQKIRDYDHPSDLALSPTPPSDTEKN